MILGDYVYLTQFFSKYLWVFNTNLQPYAKEQTFQPLKFPTLLLNVDSYIYSYYYFYIKF